MLNPQLLRNDPDGVAAHLERRGFFLDVGQLKAVGEKKAAGEDITHLMEELAGIGPQLKELEKKLATVQEQLRNIIERIPNLPHEAVPSGESEDDNVEERCWGERRIHDFEVKDHVDLGTALEMMDFEAAVKLSGARFVVMSGALATLHRALIQFMLNVHTYEHGYRETYVPYLVNSRSLFGTGQLPKFEEDQFVTASEPPYFLVPTAEVPITNLYRDNIVPAEHLPLRHVCHTPCFRQEAGSYGKDTRGMIRQHQFEKVELVQLVEPDRSWAALEELTRHAEVIQDLRHRGVVARAAAVP